MSKGEVRYEMSEGIGAITLSRPEKRNSLTQSMFAQLSDAVSQVESSDDVRVLVLSGQKGTGFCAGDDLGELVAMDAVQAREFLIMAQGICTRLESLPVPVLAAVEGFALGGGLELALSCDLILASQNARLGLPETNLGIIPGLGGCIRLPRRVGLGRAREMIFSGRIVDAQDAFAFGLVDAVLETDLFEDKVLEYARMLASKSPVSMALAKSTLNRGMDASLEAGLALEREAFAYCFTLPDAREGITAFLEKRKPVFRK
ncbi:MAG: enoyl-CoA hydratase/isomerase family protein [bacterium]|nr:MAG: enoyl-CoA hydratase/isomerase family protein [bacterium]